MTEVLKLKLETRCLGKTGDALIAHVWNAFSLGEVDVRPWDTRGAVECRDEAIAEIRC